MASEPGPPRAEDLSLARRVGALAFMGFAHAFYAWSWNTVDILRPYIAADLGLGLPQVGSLYSAQALGALIGAVVNGQLADRYGRRRALMVVMVGYGSCLLLGSLVTTLPQAMAQRLVMGYFMGSMYPIVVGLYVGLFSPGIRGRIASVILGLYNGAVALLGVAASAVFERGLDWHVLYWVGAVPVAAAAFAPLFVPDDRKLVPWGGAVGETVARRGKLPIAELFVPALRRRTVMLALLTGLNFFAYQAFSGWATTYLKTVRLLDDAQIGTVVAWQFAGSVAGGFFWGWFGDRYGRRATGLGFVLTAALIAVYLFAPLGPAALAVVACGYGAALVCSVVWGPWLTELYPPHLRSTAASIFNWGRVISFFAPIVTGVLAERAGLAPTMLVASLTFVLAAVLWLRLPETLHRPPRPDPIPARSAA